MRIAFAGTPSFAVPSLALVQQKHELVAVICQPDRASGRGRKLTPCAVKQYMLEGNSDIPIHQPDSIETLIPTLEALALDIMVVVAYGQLLSPQVLALPALGCVNVHASLLPKWRGAAPIARAIEAGDRETGISIMQMAKGLDDGDILLQQACAIEECNAGEMSDNLSIFGSQLLHETLENIENLQAAAISQDDKLASYAKKLHKEQAQIDWNYPVVDVVRKIRAFNPVPICYAELFSQNVRIYDACVSNEERLPQEAEVGSLIREKKQFFVRCLDGWIEPLKVQANGKKAMSVSDFLNGLG